MRLPVPLLTASAFFLATSASLLPSLTNVKSHLLQLRRRGPDPDIVTSDWPKYFKEAGTGAQHHYDDRFDYHGLLPYRVRQEAQRDMIRAYLEFFKEQGLETWLAHGTLLGWWWNAKNLPWDNDMDTQMSLPTLQHLALHFNNTLHTPTLPTSTSPKRTYLLDINPAHPTRLRGNGENVIDARWIDTANGLFIDLTAVSETHPSTSPGIFTCKNDHQYRTRDLYPMRTTLFEGVEARVPYAYVRILGEEYGEKSLVVTEFEGHWWNAEEGVWEKKTKGQKEQEEMDKEDARRLRLAGKVGRKKAKAKAKEGVAEEAKGVVQEVPAWASKEGWKWWF